LAASARAAAVWAKIDRDGESYRRRIEAGGYLRGPVKMFVDNLDETRRDLALPRIAA
jgi:hypothetical protein